MPNTEKSVGGIALQAIRDWSNGKYATKDDTKSAISSAISPLFKDGGVIASSALTSSLLISANEGKVYDLSSALTVDAGNINLFIEGFTGTYPKGTAVVVVETTAPQYITASGLAVTGVTYYERTGFESAYEYTVVTGLVAGVDSVDGLYTRSTEPAYKFFVLGGDTSSFLTSHQDISGKADKVVNATSGDLAKLDGNGNLIDSGISVNDILTEDDVIDNTSSTNTDKPLSANMGKSLQQQINIVKQTGRFLSLWNCITGLPESFPFESPYAYISGDRYTVSNCVARIKDNTDEYDAEKDYAVGDYTIYEKTLYKCKTAIVGGEEWTSSHWDEVVDYIPDGSSYTTGVASVTVATEEIYSNDEFLYDGTYWLHQINTGGKVDFANIAGNPRDNQELDTELTGLVKHTSDVPSGSVPINADQLNGHPDTYFANSGNFAQIEVTPSEHAYSIGDLLVFNSILYRVSSSISIGDTLAVGINLVTTNINSELNSALGDIVRHKSDVPASAMPINSSQLNGHPDTYFGSAGNLAVIETSPATLAHSKGDLLVYNGTLYKAAEAISIGDTLTVGTNITGATVASAISDIIKHISFDATTDGAGYTIYDFNRQVRIISVFLNGRNGTNVNGWMVGFSKQSNDYPYRKYYFVVYDNEGNNFGAKDITIDVLYQEMN